MAAAKLVTRCPACRTAFRLVADQLRLRQGLVRCGQCDTVFDAREHLIEVPVPAAAPASAAAPTAAPVPTPVPTQVPTTARPSVAAALAHAEQAQASARAHAQQTPFDPGFDPGYDVPALDSPTMMMPEAEQPPVREAPEAEPAPEAPQPEVELGLAPEHETEAEPEPSAEPEREPVADVAPEPEPEPGPEPIEEAAAPAPSAPWPTLDHAAFGEPAPAPSAPAPVVPAHSSLDPAAAFAPASASPPPSGAYSAKPAWPPVVPSSPPSNPPSSPPVSPPASPTPVAAEPLPPTNPFPHTEPVRSASEYLRAADPTVAPAEEFARDHGDDAASASADALDTSREGTPDAIARESTTRHWIRREVPPGPVFAPDFLRHARDRERARPARAKVVVPVSKRVWVRIAVVLLAIGALLQGAYLGRSQLAGHVPVLRPLLEAACAPLGCEVPPWRDLEALRIDSSQLQKQDEATDVYQLAVTMRNQGRATTALPAIELVMTDLQDQLLLRRVLQPAEYLEPAQRAFATLGLRAGSELPVRVRFRTDQTAANYRVLIFYP